MTRFQDHSECSSHIVQGELLLRIDEQVDSILGLAVFFKYIRAAALNDEQERRHVSVFTTELFAHYLHIKILSVAKCRQIPETSAADEIQRYQTCICNLPEIFLTDVMVFIFATHTKYLPNDRRVMADRGEAKSPRLHQLDTSKLVELLQQSAIEHLTICRQLEVREFDSLTHSFVRKVVKDFTDLYAYRCGSYQRCLQLSMENVLRMMVVSSSTVQSEKQRLYPELIQLMDDDIVSLIGLMELLRPSSQSDRRYVQISQLSLSLYLTVQCQIKLHDSVTSLTKTLHFVRRARSNIKNLEHGYEYTADRPVLKFVEEKLWKYIIRPKDHFWE